MSLCDYTPEQLEELHRLAEEFFSLNPTNDGNQENSDNPTGICGSQTEDNSSKEANRNTSEGKS